MWPKHVLCSGWLFYSGRCGHCNISCIAGWADWYVDLCADTLLSITMCICVSISSVLYCFAMLLELLLTQDTLKWVRLLNECTVFLISPQIRKTTFPPSTFSLSFSPFHLSPSSSLPPSLPPEPSFISISHTHIVAASKTAFYVWHYRTTSRLAAPELTHITSRKGREGQDRWALNCTYTRGYVTAVGTLSGFPSYWRSKNIAWSQLVCQNLLTYSSLFVWPFQRSTVQGAHVSDISTLTDQYRPPQLNVQAPLWHNTMKARCSERGLYQSTI